MSSIQKEEEILFITHSEIRNIMSSTIYLQSAFKCFINNRSGHICWGWRGEQSVRNHLGKETAKIIQSL